MEERIRACLGERLTFLSPIPKEFTSCENCHILGEKFHVCKKCKTAFYCCKRCQVNDWKDHKWRCKTTQQSFVLSQNLITFSTHQLVLQACLQQLGVPPLCEIIFSYYDSSPDYLEILNWGRLGEFSISGLSIGIQKIFKEMPKGLILKQNRNDAYSGFIFCPDGKTCTMLGQKGLGSRSSLRVCQRQQLKNFKDESVLSFSPDVVYIKATQSVTCYQFQEKKRILLPDFVTDSEYVEYLPFQNKPLWIIYYKYQMLNLLLFSSTSSSCLFKHVHIVTFPFRGEKIQCRSVWRSGEKKGKVIFTSDDEVFWTTWDIVFKKGKFDKVVTQTETKKLLPYQFMSPWTQAGRHVYAIVLPNQKRATEKVQLLYQLLYFDISLEEMRFVESAGVLNLSFPFQVKSFLVFPDFIVFSTLGGIEVSRRR